MPAWVMNVLVMVECKFWEKGKLKIDLMPNEHRKFIKLLRDVGFWFWILIIDICPPKPISFIFQTILHHCQVKLWIESWFENWWIFMNFMIHLHRWYALNYFLTSRKKCDHNSSTIEYLRHTMILFLLFDISSRCSMYDLSLK